MANGGKPGVQSPSGVQAWLKKLWNAHPLVVVAGVTVIAVALAVALIWPITDLIAAHDVGLITGSKRAAVLQTAREAVRTQLLTLGAGVFAAGALIFTARNFTLSRTTFRATEVRVLNERFATAAEKLGSDKTPAVRLAGIYAMAGLADDWEVNRQVCIDVLCGYLRIASTQLALDDASSTRRDLQADREVRHALIRTITAHLRDGAAVSWQGKDFDLTGVVFDGGDFSHARFSGGRVDFSSAQFSGTVDFSSAQFSGGKVSFSSAKFSGSSTVDFSSAQFSGAAVDFGAEFSGGKVDFSSAQFSGGTVDFGGGVFSGGTVSFGFAVFSGGTVSFYFAQFSGGTVSFSFAQFSSSSRVFFFSAKFSGSSTVDFTSAQFSGGAVDFTNAQFSGGTVDFSFAQFSGGEVSFSPVDEWSHPPRFDWEGTPPAGVELPAGIGGEAQ